jgi:hypothetical protein
MWSLMEEDKDLRDELEIILIKESKKKGKKK